VLLLGGLQNLLVRLSETHGRVRLTPDPDVFRHEIIERAHGLLFRPPTEGGRVDLNPAELVVSGPFDRVKNRDVCVGLLRDRKRKLQRR
jgi:hypothetical protein